MSVTVENIMKLPVMRDAKLVSKSGLDNKVQYVTVAEAPKIHFPNYSEGIFVLTTLSAYHDSLERINALIEGLCAVNVAAIGIKLGRFIDRIDPSTVAIVEKYHVPLFLLPSTVYFRDILSEVLSAITGNQKILLNQINEMNEELLNAIAQNRRIQDILELLCEKIRCYCSCQISPSEKYAEASSLTTKVDAAEIRAGLIEYFADPMRFKSGYRRGSLYVFPCIVQGRLLSAVCVYTDQADPELVHTLAQAVTNGISIKLLERDLKEQAERGVIASLMDDILFSQKTDANLAKERLSSMSFSLRKNYLVLVLASRQIRTDMNWLNVVGNIQNIFSLRFPSALAFKRGTECVLFLSYDADISTEKLRRQLKLCLTELEETEKQEFHLACSTVSQDLSMMSECYRQAKKAIWFAQTMGNESRVYLYIDYYELGLLSYGLESSERKMFEDIIVKPILAHDEQTHGNLWLTLEESILSRTLDQAAKNMHIHISTLRYRLQKIEAITSCSFFDHHGRIKLYLAYVLHQMLKNERVV